MDAYATLVEKRGGRCLVCLDIPADKLPSERFSVTIKTHRSLRQHRMYWGMLGQVVEATGRWASTRELHQWLKYELGYYTPTEVRDGRVVLEWDSTDFRSMGAEKFKRFLDLSIATIALEVGFDPTEITPMEVRT